jgi:O-antigen ligase
VVAGVALASAAIWKIAGPQAGLASVVVLGLVLVGLQRLLVSLAAVVVSIPLQSEFELSIGDRPVTWTKIAVVALLVAFAVRFLAGASRLELTTIAWGLGAVVLALAASIYNANDRLAWAGEVYRWLIAFVVYLIAVEATSDDRFVPIVGAATSISVIGAAVGGFYQVLAGSGPVTFEVRGITRAYSGFGEPNPFAGYLEMTVPLLLALTLAWLLPGVPGAAAKRPASWFVGIVGGAALLGSLAIMLSQSRGGLLGFAAGVATVLLLSGGWPRFVVVAVIAIVMLAITLPPLGTEVRQSLVSAIGNPTERTLVTPENWAAQERISHWRAGLAMWKKYPVLGVGAGNYSDHYRAETRMWRFRISRGHAHNGYIQAAAQSGTVGVLAYLALIGSVIAASSRRLAEAGPETRSVVVGAIAVTVAVIVHGFFDYLHVLSLGLQLSVVWAAIEVAGRQNPPHWPRHEASACQP